MDELVVVNAGEEPPDQWVASVFLAGPTPRSADVVSWRPGAIAAIRRRWRGPGTLVVFVPEPSSGATWPEYEHQRTWELRWGDRADQVLFWIPRGPGMPALTTNDEFGRWKDSGRVVLGTPPGAESMRYQRGYAADHRIPTAATLEDTIDLALARIGSGAPRTGGERHVPLLIWRTPSFQGWLARQAAEGNELLSGRLEWTFRVGEDLERVFLWAFHAQVHVGAENRVKTNEVVLARPDIATVVAYRRGPGSAEVGTIAAADTAEAIAAVGTTEAGTTAEVDTAEAVAARGIAGVAAEVGTAEAVAAVSSADVADTVGTAEAVAAVGATAEVGTTAAMGTAAEVGPVAAVGIADVADTEVVLVREFRTPGGFVLELPGGSSWGDEPPREVAAVELGEETGLSIAPERLRAHHVRPLAATFSAHRQHLFSVELTEAELAAVRAVTGPLGEAGSTERTYPRVARFGDLMAGGEVDWTTLGALAEVLLGQPERFADGHMANNGSAGGPAGGPANKGSGEGSAGGSSGEGSADEGSADTAPAAARPGVS